MIDAREIQDRLENLSVIDHIVRSMKAMSAIRWRRARDSLEAVQRYAARVQEQLSTAVSYPTPLVQRARARTTRRREPRADRVGLAVISSDHGLCGPFNTVLFRTADVYIRRWREKNQRVSVIALGEYARRYYCNKSDMCYLLWTHRFPLTHTVSFIETRDVWRKVEELYQQENLDELYLVYNAFISFGRYRQRLVRLLPPELTPSEPARENLPILGSDAQELQQYLLFEHLALQLYLGLVESMVSEQSARLQAMDAAKNNIDERTAELNRAYHIARQEGITAEMLEIASGTGFESSLSP
jgi:F-type H+-transporting ATPase subunit gamma